MVGFGGNSGSFIDRLFARCAALTVSGTAGAYSVTVEAPVNGSPIGPSSGTPFTSISCPPGAIALGVLGAAGQSIDQFGLHCAKPVVGP
jgi:hypothetical protein